MKFDKYIPSQMYRYWVTLDAKTGFPPLQKQADMKLSSCCIQHDREATAVNELLQIGQCCQVLFSSISYCGYVIINCSPPKRIVLYTAC
jgi:hypothetical protein